MVRFKKKFLFLNVYENWFHCDPSFIDLILPNAYLHVKNRKDKIIPGFSDITYTVENDLTLDHDTMYAGFQKSLRQQIRQSEEAGIKCYFHDDIDGFVSFFNDFAASKNLPPTSKRRIEEMEGFLKLSYAELDGMVLVAHSTLVDEKNKIVRAFHSASKRLDDSFDKSLIGKANKVLHYRDMTHFKELGYEVYDFGGYTENTEDKALQGINNFKLLFGGQKVACTNYYTVSYYIMRKIGQWIGALEKG
ncbi:GNAT family N-acetyltransferase [Flavihumibacter fluvii]|uniref:GNAT family N-acetyltransferase n=1 Tax=Flavihumibacter fluvii TaxID=2838157 RepID=UPI001BDECCFC|nr:GNAT family N-acetyltransferase [Flavihumibacter fluvii]ULQ54437.1 GNAT family N-acetyltransferase [Flavihumibacter fluvii]